MINITNICFLLKYWTRMNLTDILKLSLKESLPKINLFWQEKDE